MAIIDYFSAAVALDQNGRVIRDAEADVYALGDTSFTTPLAITDPSGVPMAKLRSNSDGIYPEFRVVNGAQQIIAKSGDRTTPMTSLGVIAKAAEDARDEAQAAADEIGSAVGTVQAARDQAVTARDQAVAVGNTNDTIMASRINDPASASRQALDTAIDARTAALSRAADQASLSAQAVEIARVASVFVRPAGGVSVSREGNDYLLWHGLGSGLFARFRLMQQSTNAGNYPLRQLARLDTIQATLDTDDSAATKVGTWVAGSNVDSVGGAYVYSVTTDDTITWNSPSDATAVGVTVAEVTNGGRLMRVEIDGSRTAADRLPTAAEVVARGWYASTILVANGGVLNPTDRVMDSYAASVGTTRWTARRLLTSGLAAAAHEVKITVTPYQRVGLSSQRSYITGFLHATQATKLSTSGASATVDTILCNVNSAWEYAFYGTPAGATSPGEVGNIHGHEVEIGFTVRVDGATPAIADGSRVDATREIVVTRVTQFRHPELGTTAVADVVTTYTLDRNGLRVDVAITWNRSFTPQWAWTMLPVNGVTTLAEGAKFNRAALLASPEGPIVLTGADGDRYAGRSKSVAAWMWWAGGKFGVMGAVPDHTTFLNSWKDSAPAFAQVNDRNGNISKLYWARAAAGGDAFQAGKTMALSILYRVGYFPNGADAVLSAL